MKFPSLRLIVLLSTSTFTATVLTAGCGSGDDEAKSGDKNGTGGEGGQTGASGDSTPVLESFCQSDKNCQDSAQVCDSTRSVCVDCAVDADCGNDSICRATSCIAITPCESSKQCAIDQVCSTTLNYCVGCEGNADCGDEEVCHETQCVLSCASDKDCPASSEVCNTDLSVCRECVAHADCEESQFCATSGQCLTDVCDQGDSTCTGGSLSSCEEAGGGFETAVCADGCATDAKSCATAGNCITGDEDCKCYANDSCNSDLSCLNRLCVDAVGGTGGGSGSGTGGSGSETEFCDKPEAIADFENASITFCVSSSPGAIGRWSLNQVRVLPASRGASDYGLNVITTTKSAISSAEFSAEYDASAFQGIGFWAKGDGQVFGLGIHTTATQADGFKGFLLDAQDMNVEVTLTGEWVFYEVMFSDLTPTGKTTTLDASTLREIQFLVAPNQNFWIDDLVFVTQ